jgi:hypothetical protein
MGLPYPARVALWIALAAAGPPLVADTDSKAATFKLPLSSSEVVLEYSLEGRWSSTTRIYGDGRLVRSQSGVAIETKTEEELTRLEVADLEALVRIAVDGGLFEATQDDLRRKDSVGIPHASLTTLTIELADYKGEGRKRLHLQLLAPMYAARFNKDNPYIVAFGAIEEQILIIEGQSRAH